MDDLIVRLRYRADHCATRTNAAHFRQAADALESKDAEIYTLRALLREALILPNLVLELAEAVDNMAADIGGDRPQIEILREAVQSAERIRAALGDE